MKNESAEKIIEGQKRSNQFVKIVNVTLNYTSFFYLITRFSCQIIPKPKASDDHHSVNHQFNLIVTLGYAANLYFQNT